MAWSERQYKAYQQQQREQTANAKADLTPCTPRTARKPSSGGKSATPQNLTLRNAYKAANGGADWNHGEECFVTAWKQLAGVPLPFQRQVAIRPSRNWKLDFFDWQTGLAVEVSGQVHSIKEKRQADTEKWNACAEEGICLLHYTVEQIENDPAKCITQVLALWHNRRESEQK